MALTNQDIFTLMNAGDDNINQFRDRTDVSMGVWAENRIDNDAALAAERLLARDIVSGRSPISVGAMTYVLIIGSRDTLTAGQDFSAIADSVIQDKVDAVLIDWATIA